ncbi:hypothetical protein BB561_002695 [Smittium simulii]|uniref:P-type ATPase A domain-containing protein n=1 Tax=Smittium simulii TaxID=133385 RepID=A0A2T9YPM9_9FUNG|nr:hypothetical protein BB561_002695 [Smittium simulii]
MAKFDSTVNVYRDKVWRTCLSHDLVPGDIISISDLSSNIIPCDAILLEGSCITNESMLTGESVPVTKTPATPETLERIDLTSPSFPLEISTHFLFSGTSIIRAKKTELGFGGKSWIISDSNYERASDPKNIITPIFPTRATALVARTGFNTSKGVLVRSILFPKNTSFKLYDDAFKFIGILAIIALCGFITSAINFFKLGLSLHVIIVRALDLITVVVPPALPASMSIGTSFSLSRLKEKLIYCISPTRINVCGRINLMAFDKTGTLTEEGLDVLGIQSYNFKSKHLHIMTQDINEIIDSSDDNYSLENLNIVHALASCHSIKSVFGNLIGDPLDIKMFQSTGWTLEELEYDNDSNNCLIETPSGALSSKAKKIKKMLPTIVRPPIIMEDHKSINNASKANSDENFKSCKELGIVKTFDFSPSLRRMCVITRHPMQKGAQLYVKGAPETIRNLCLPETIPNNFSEILLQYTYDGFRVIALAGKISKLSWAKLQKLNRNEIETDLVFLGFIVFENKLKPTTEHVIHQLSTAKIPSIMCTGDNIFTAVSVARQSGIISESTEIYLPVLVQLGEDSLAEVYSTNSVLKKVVMWQNMDNPLKILDPYTFTPLICKNVGFSALDLNPDQSIINIDNHNSLAIDVMVDNKLFKQKNYALAISGSVFRHLMDNESQNTANKALMLGLVFARMSPDEKGELMEFYREMGYCVGFCGDGANDCSALKAADVGLSLSEAESSVAAPFTSKSNHIGCVLDVIKEGRAALVTSFSCFKFMALYSMIQFTTVSLLYTFGGGLGDFQFLYIDLFIIFPLSITMARTLPYGKLFIKPPTATLLSKKVLTSLFFQILLFFFLQKILYNLVKNQSFYTEPIHENPNEIGEIIIVSYENTHRNTVPEI